MTLLSEVWANKATIEKYYESQTPSMFNFDVADVEGKLIKAAPISIQYSAVASSSSRSASLAKFKSGISDQKYWTGYIHIVKD